MLTAFVILSNLKKSLHQKVQKLAYERWFASDWIFLKNTENLTILSSTSGNTDNTEKPKFDNYHVSAVTRDDNLHYPKEPYNLIKSALYQRN